jgi:hypothetical protein
VEEAESPDCLQERERGDVSDHGREHREPRVRRTQQDEGGHAGQAGEGDQGRTRPGPRVLTLAQRVFSIDLPGIGERRCPMNSMERLLHDEITRLLDRLAAAVPDGSERLRAANPTLRLRLDEMETTLAGIRNTLLEGYGRWGQALGDLENLWALAAWRSAACEEAAEKAPALAA